MVPKDSQVPIPRICDYVTIHSKGGIFYVIRLKILRWRDYPRLSRQALIAIAMSYDRQRDIRQTEDETIR